MAFSCPQCRTAGSLEIIASICLPADSRSDEIALQVVACGNCQYRAIAVYEESRRGAFDSDNWHHTGYRIDGPVVEETLKAILSCPNPVRTDCGCPAHQELNRLDPRGAWLGPASLMRAETFSMHLDL
jgi:hypothetical protein